MLDSLLIKNFRSLSHLEVSKLGRVNLLVGKNNSGKSTVLEALQIYAGNANRPLLEKIAQGHDERVFVSENDQTEETSSIPLQDFFPDRCFPDDISKSIEIGSLSSTNSKLTITHAVFEDVSEEVVSSSGETVKTVRTKTYIPNEQISPEDMDQSQIEVYHGLFVRKGDDGINVIKLNKSSSSRLGRLERINISNAMPCSFIPTQFVSMDELADAWDKIALTPQEEVVGKALKIIEPNFENLVFVKSELKTGFQARKEFERKPMVKLKQTDRPVPLNSLGDGMLRVLQLVLKIFPAKGGFLLIDELENGLHYSSLEKVWSLLFEMAEKLQIQIFATTHSWDCIESFSRVANERTDIDGVLFRLGRSAKNSNKGQIVATVFNEEELCNITQTDVEVR